MSYSIEERDGLIVHAIHRAFMNRTDGDKPLVTACQQYFGKAENTWAKLNDKPVTCIVCACMKGSAYDDHAVRR